MSSTRSEQTQGAWLSVCHRVHPDLTGRVPYARERAKSMNLYRLSVEHAGAWQRAGGWLVRVTVEVVLRRRSTSVGGFLLAPSFNFIVPILLAPWGRGAARPRSPFRRQAPSTSPGFARKKIMEEAAHFSRNAVARDAHEAGVAEVSSNLYENVTRYHAQVNWTGALMCLSTCKSPGESHSSQCLPQCLLPQIGHNVNKDELQQLEWNLLGEAKTLFHQRKFEEALNTFTHCLAVTEKTRSAKDHAVRGAVIHNIASCLHNLGEMEAAQVLSHVPKPRTRFSASSDSHWARPSSTLVVSLFCRCAIRLCARARVRAHPGPGCRSLAGVLRAGHRGVQEGQGTTAGTCHLRRRQ